MGFSSLKSFFCQTAARLHEFISATEADLPER
jgi:hypothetical protein